MICKHNTDWYDSKEPLFPLNVTVGSSLASSKLYTVVKNRNSGADAELVFPHCNNPALCVYEVGQMDFSVSLVKGSYSNMCRLGNVLYPTERRTTKTWKAYDYSYYDSYLHVSSGMPGDGSNAEPAYYQWEYSASSPTITGYCGASIALFVACRATDAGRISLFHEWYQTRLGVSTSTGSLSLTDKNPYWYIKPTSFSVNYGGVNYPVYMIGCDVLRWRDYGFSSSGDYVNMSYGIELTQITTSTVFAILKGLVVLPRPHSV